MVNEIKLTVLRETGERFLFSEIQSVEWASIPWESDSNDYTILGTKVINSEDFCGYGGHFGISTSGLQSSEEYGIADTMNLARFNCWHAYYFWRITIALAYDKSRQREQEFIIGGDAEPEGSRKYFGVLLVGFYEGTKLKFAGRVGTGFSERLLSTLFTELNKIRAENCPSFNLPATGRSRWDQGLTPAEMKRCHWVEPVMVCQIKFTEWTRDDRLRQPVFLGIREDKKANEVVREKAN